MCRFPTSSPRQRNPSGEYPPPSTWQHYPYPPRKPHPHHNPHPHPHHGIPALPAPQFLQPDRPPVMLDELQNLPMYPYPYPYASHSKPYPIAAEQYPSQHLGGYHPSPFAYPQPIAYHEHSFTPPYHDDGAVARRPLASITPFESPPALALAGPALAPVSVGYISPPPVITQTVTAKDKSQSTDMRPLPASSVSVSLIVAPPPAQAQAQAPSPPPSMPSIPWPAAPPPTPTSRTPTPPTAAPESAPAPAPEPTSPPTAAAAAVTSTPEAMPTTAPVPRSVPPLRIPAALLATLCSCCGASPVEPHLHEPIWWEPTPGQAVSVPVLWSSKDRGVRVPKPTRQSSTSSISSSISSSSSSSSDSSSSAAVGGAGSYAGSYYASSSSSSYASSSSSSSSGVKAPSSRGVDSLGTWTWRADDLGKYWL